MYHDRTAWRCAFFVGKKYGSKGYPQGNAAHMGIGFVTYLLNRPRILIFIFLNSKLEDETFCIV
jgi:hypothetical protein